MTEFEITPSKIVLDTYFFIKMTAECPLEHAIHNSILILPT